MLEEGEEYWKRGDCHGGLFAESPTEEAQQSVQLSIPFDPLFLGGEKKEDWVTPSRISYLGF
jgi:hypothetical protein